MPRQCPRCGSGVPKHGRIAGDLGRWQQQMLHGCSNLLLMGMDLCSMWHHRYEGMCDGGHGRHLAMNVGSCGSLEVGWVLGESIFCLFVGIMVMEPLGAIFLLGGVCLGWHPPFLSPWILLVKTHPFWTGSGDGSTFVFLLKGV